MGPRSAGCGMRDAGCALTYACSLAKAVRSDHPNEQIFQADRARELRAGAPHQSSLLPVIAGRGASHARSTGTATGNAFQNAEERRAR